MTTNYGDVTDSILHYALGGTDASVAVLAERRGTDLIVTLDRRHFAAIRSTKGGSFRLLPG